MRQIGLLNKKVDIENRNLMSNYEMPLLQNTVEFLGPLRDNNLVSNIFEETYSDYFIKKDKEKDTSSEKQHNGKLFHTPTFSRCSTIELDYEAETITENTYSKIENIVILITNKIKPGGTPNVKRKNIQNGYINHYLQDLRCSYSN